MTYMAKGVIRSNTPIAERNASDTIRGMKIARLTISAGSGGGGVLSWQNPESGSIIITRMVVDITTASTGASTIDIGTTATSATTSSDNLVDGVSGAATGIVGNLGNPGTNGKTAQKLAAGKWVTASQATGAVAGIAGVAYIHYFSA